MSRRKKKRFRFRQYQRGRHYYWDIDDWMPNYKPGGEMATTNIVVTAELVNVASSAGTSNRFDTMVIVDYDFEVSAKKTLTVESSGASAGAIKLYIPSSYGTITVSVDDDNSLVASMKGPGKLEAVAGSGSNPLTEEVVLELWREAVIEMLIDSVVSSSGYLSSSKLLDKVLEDQSAIDPATSSDSNYRYLTYYAIVQGWDEESLESRLNFRAFYFLDNSSSLGSDYIYANALGTNAALALANETWKDTDDYSASDNDNHVWKMVTAHQDSGAQLTLCKRTVTQRTAKYNGVSIGS